MLSGGLLACIFEAGTSPELPMAVYLLLIPVAALSLRMSVLHEHSNESAMRCLGSAMLWSSLAALLVWAIWVGTGHSWTGHNKKHWSDNLHCIDREDIKKDDEGEAKVTREDAEGNEYTICRSVFVLWVSPLIVAGINGLLASWRRTTRRRRWSWNK